MNSHDMLFSDYDEKCVARNNNGKRGMVKKFMRLSTPDLGKFWKASDDWHRACVELGVSRLHVNLFTDPDVYLTIYVSSEKWTTRIRLKVSTFLYCEYILKIAYLTAAINPQVREEFSPFPEIVLRRPVTAQVGMNDRQSFEWIHQQ